MRQHHRFVLNESKTAALRFARDPRFQVMVGLWLTWTTAFSLAIGTLT